MAAAKREFHTGIPWGEVVAGASGLWSQVVTQVAAAPWDAVFWECAPWDPRQPDALASFVLCDAPALARCAPDPRPFAEHIDAGRGSPLAATFRSLGMDAWLVAPTAERAASIYAHLAPFCRGASAAQIEAVGRSLGAALQVAAVEHDGPLWVSTSGLGVAWLHLRIDTRPKYYTHGPYRVPPPRRSTGEPS